MTEKNQYFEGGWSRPAAVQADGRRLAVQGGRGAGRRAAASGAGRREAAGAAGRPRCGRAAAARQPRCRAPAARSGPSAGQGE